MSYGGYGPTQGFVASKVGSAAYPLLAPNGSAAAPSYSFSSESSLGIYYGTSGLAVFSANASSAGWNSGGLILHQTAGALQWGSAGLLTADLKLVRAAAATLQMGADVNGAAVAQTFKAHDGITGTDVAGANLTLAGGRGTGAGAVGNLLLATSTLLGSGTTAQTLTTRVTITGTEVTSTLPIVGPAGSAAAVPFALGEVNTGLYRFAASQVGVACGGSLGLVITATTLSIANDCTMVRDAANVWALKNGTTAQEVRVYGTTTGPKYASFSHNGTISIATDSGGSGIRLGSSGGNVGFYGTTPIALQTGVAVTAGGIHAALVALGLITA